MARQLPSGRWQARIKTPDGNHHALGTHRTKREAVAAEEHARTQLRTDTFIPPTDGTITLTDWLNHWLDTLLDLAPSTIKRYRSSCDVISDHLGHVPIGDLTPDAVRRFITARVNDGTSPYTCRNDMRCLQAAMAHAVRERRIPRDPTDGVRTPRLPKHQMLILTPEQFDAYIAKLTDPRAVAVSQFLVFTGCRWGEMAGRRVSDVDLLHSRLHIHDQWSQVDGRRPTKTYKTREVPITPPLRPVIEEAMDGKGPDELLFATGNGNPLRSANFSNRKMRPALRAAGLDDAFRPHDFRHSCASWLIRGGQSPVSVSQWLGHADVSTTLDTYSHLFPDDLNLAAVALADVYGQRGGVVAM